MSGEIFPPRLPLLLPFHPPLHIGQKILFEFIRLQDHDMGDPGFENVLDGLVLAHPEGDNKRSVRSFLLDLLSREHLAPPEIVADLGVYQNSHLQVLLPCKPDVGAALKGCIQILGNSFEYVYGEAEIRDPVEGVTFKLFFYSKM
jgi:hypothetical protein